MLQRWLTCALLAVAAVVAAYGPAAAEEPFKFEGEYFIRGWDPGHDPTGRADYEGSAVLTPWGQTLRYHGFMDNMTYAGAAIYDDQTRSLSLSFTNGDGSERGVTRLRVSGDHLEGWWALDNGGRGELGYEIWTRK